MIISKIQGGIGNQMFQYATGRSISLRNNTDLKLDIDFFNEEKFKGIYRLNQFNIIENIASQEEISSFKSVPSNKIYAKITRRLGLPNKYNKITHLIENTKNGRPDHKILTCGKNAYIDGWLGKEKYFETIRSELLKDFTLKYQSDDYNVEMLNEILNCNAVSIHIRRGDYLDNAYFTSLPMTYYYSAVRTLQQKLNSPVFFVFSDDIEWVKDNFKINLPVRFIEKNSKRLSYYLTQKDFEDLNLMKHCKHNIIANSTFSWWGAWLNDNLDKIVIAPKIWYSDKIAQKNYENNSFIPSTWIKF